MDFFTIISYRYQKPRGRTTFVRRRGLLINQSRSLRREDDDHRRLGGRQTICTRQVLGDVRHERGTLCTGLFLVHVRRHVERTIKVPYERTT